MFFKYTGFSFLILLFIFFFSLLNISFSSENFYNSKQTIEDLSDKVYHSLSEDKKLNNLDSLEGFWENKDFIFYFFRVDNQIFIKNNKLIFSKEISFLDNNLFSTKSTYTADFFKGKKLQVKYVEGNGKGLIHDNTEVLMESLTDTDLVIYTPHKSFGKYFKSLKYEKKF